MRKGLTVFLVLACFALALATTTSPKYPTTTANTDYSSGVAWTNPNNVQADDANEATCSLDMDLSQHSDWIKCTGFGFTSSDVPAGATINQIVVLVKCTGGADQADNYIIVQMLKADTLVGDLNQFTSTTTPTEYNFSTLSYLWGTTWTQSDVVASTFGVSVRMEGSALEGGVQNQYINYVKIGIDYTEAGSTVRKQVIR
jgi:hypothetical protein